METEFIAWQQCSAHWPQKAAHTGRAVQLCRSAPSWSISYSRGTVLPSQAVRSWDKVLISRKPGCLVGVQKVECSISKVIRINAPAQSRHFLLPEHVTCTMSASHALLTPGCSSRAPCHQGRKLWWLRTQLPYRWPGSPNSWDAVVLERDFLGVPQEGLLEGEKGGFVSWWALQSLSKKATESLKSCQRLNDPSSFTHFGVSMVGANELSGFLAFSALPSHCFWGALGFCNALTCRFKPEW